jgi:hypothetical protein
MQIGDRVEAVENHRCFFKGERFTITKIDGPFLYLKEIGKDLKYLSRRFKVLTKRQK